MPLNDKDLSFIAIGAIVVFVLSYCAYQNSDDNGKTQPRYDGELATAGQFGAMVIDSLDTGDHYFHPNMLYPGQQQVFTAHRYPVISGGNITALIHQGMDAMRRQAPQDADWIERPPGEVMW
jgi:hypothetical protein